MTAPALVSDATADAPASRADLHRTTWALAWPVIFSFSIESLVGLLDMLMVGRLGATAVASVGVGVQIMGAVDATLFAVGTGALADLADAYVTSGRAAEGEAFFRRFTAEHPEHPDGQRHLDRLRAAR